MTSNHGTPHTMNGEWCQCPDCDENAADAPRQVAADWHGGQTSPMLAFASTGSIVAGLEAEIRDNLKLLRAGQYSADEINAETPRLSALLAYVVAQTPELDWDGFTCSVCGDGFDAESWDERHTDPGDELSEVHAGCCSECAK